MGPELSSTSWRGLSTNITGNSSVRKMHLIFTYLIYLYYYNNEVYIFYCSPIIWSLFLAQISLVLTIRNSFSLASVSLWHTAEGQVTNWPSCNECISSIYKRKKYHVCSVIGLVLSPSSVSPMFPSHILFPTNSYHSPYRRCSGVSHLYNFITPHIYKEALDFFTTICLLRLH